MAELPGRSTPLETADRHFVLGRPIKPPFPEGFERVLFGMGCFWGAEKAFWSLEGVHVTAVGYAGGTTPNPTYQEVCTGLTGHAEVVLVVYDPARIELIGLLKTFWESHDPTQGMRQGADVGTQYRSAVFVSSSEQASVVLDTRDQYQRELSRVGLGPITTEVGGEPEFFYAEDYHQQYLAKNPSGYCGLGGTGACLAIG